MGSVSMAISNAAKEAGVHIATNAEVFCYNMQLLITFYSLEASSNLVFSFILSILFF